MKCPFALLLIGLSSCQSSQPDGAPRAIATTPVASTGPVARQLLATPGFAWRSFETRHIRLHLSADMATGLVAELADSAESARVAALALLGETELADEPPLELILVGSRDEMQRLVGRPIGGSGFPGELTVAAVAGAGYRPFFRHELTHAYVARRWGQRRAGAWMDEGLATRATGPCQGYSVDAVVAGYAAGGNAPAFEALTGQNFYSLPDLPSYFSAGSLVEFLDRAEGVAFLRALWRGERPDVDATHPLGAETQRLQSQWQRQVSAARPATLDTARLRREGC